MMQLLSKELETKFIAYNEEHKDKELKISGDTPVLVKYFNAFGRGTWIITHVTKVGNDWKLYGLCDLGFPEIGPVMLSELVTLQAQGIRIERDLWIDDDATLADVMRVSGITEPAWLLK